MLKKNNSFKKRFLLILAILFVTSFRSELLANNWEELYPGVVKSTFTLLMKDKSTLNIYAVRIDSKRVKIKVVNVYGTLSKQKAKQFPVYSLREVISLLNPQVIINGGFLASYSLPIAAGLLIENNNVVTRLNKDSRIQAGIFCVKNNEVNIVSREKFNEKDCIYALQSGPILVERSGKVAIDRSEMKGGKYRRSVVAMDKHRRIVLVASNESYLYDLANFLANRESDGGLDCIEALNLSGDTDSGIYTKRKNVPEIFGNIDGPVSSAIAVFGE